MHEQTDTRDLQAKNWPACNEALRRRGSLTIWFDPEMSWEAAATGRRGRRQSCSDAAIQTCLSMKVLFGMALRQRTGFVGSLLRLIGLDWSVPDLSTLSRRTADKIGVAEGNNSGNATFEAWWNDSFIQGLVLQALEQAGVPEALVEDGKQLVEVAARAADEVEAGSSPRQGAWRLLSRLFSIDAEAGLKPGVAISLACGFPPMRAGVLAAKEQVGTLRSLAEAMSGPWLVARPRC